MKSDPGLWSFLVSPGFGGLAALLAAVIAYVAALSRNKQDQSIANTKNSTERSLARTAAASARQLAEDNDFRQRWWDLAMWLWANRVDLGSPGVLELLKVLERRAETPEQDAFLAGVVTSMQARGGGDAATP